MVKRTDNIWLKICIGSYFEVECLRNDYHNAIIVQDELDIDRNQYILSSKKFKLVVGKTNRGKIYYYDIPQVIMDLLVQCHKNQIGCTYNYWNYNTRKIFNELNLKQGLVNYLRICKAKWIESLDLPLKMKEQMHVSMGHTYDTTIHNYL